MSQAEYDTKLRSVHRFIPFLENMIIQLKDPKMKNREQQLSKMESLYQMITDKNKKLKIDTLQKCEEVILKLYFKVKGANATLPPPCNPNKTAECDDNRKPINLYSLAAESMNQTVAPDTTSNIQPKSFMLRKPPISYSDLECLEKDVAQELEKKMSLNELNTLRNRLCRELEDSDTINTTVRNKPIMAKLNAASPDKNKKKIENTASQHKNDPKKDPVNPKKIDVPKVGAPKVLKEGDLFCNAFSEIDKTYEIGLKKKEERRSSTHKEKKEAQMEDDNTTEKASLKQLSERAAQFRNITKPAEKEATETSSSKSNSAQEPRSNSQDFPAVSTKKPENSNDKDDKERSKSSKETSSNDRDAKRDEHKKDKNEKSHKSEHKKDKDDRSRDKSRDKSKKDHDKDMDRKDRTKEKTREKNSKILDKKDEHKNVKTSEKDHDTKKSRTETKKELRKDHKESKEPKSDLDEVIKNIEIAMKQDVPNKNEIDNSNNEKSPKDDLDDLTKKIEAIMNANSNLTQETKITDKPALPEKSQAQEKKVEETKPVNRDPRLKPATNVAPDPGGRLAFKYNPKPKKQEVDNVLDKSVLDSIEKSMKLSNKPLPPKPTLTAPPAPPDDLFSPQSPDEIDKAAVPPLLNDLLLRPETTGVINEVVSALRRSNNASLASNKNLLNNEPKLIPQPVMKPTQTIHFSPPSQGLKFISPVDTPRFIPPQHVPNNQSRPYNPYSPTDSIDRAKDLNEFQMPRNQGLQFDPLGQRLNHYEDRTNQGFFNMDRPLNYVPPPQNYVDSGFVPPSPSFVPPSPIYDSNVESWDTNYQNFQGVIQPRYFEGERGMVRPRGLLGDAPRMPCNSQFGQQNFDNYSRFGGRGINLGNNMDPRSSYYGAVSRDPRTNRGPQFPTQDPRPMCRERGMTYREYKEQKERENREREMREKEIRDREALEKQQKERDEADKNARVAKEDAENNKKDSESDKRGTSNRDKAEDRERDDSRFNRNERSRSRNRSRDRYSGNRSTSRYRRDEEDSRGREDRKDKDNRRGRSRERSRYGESKFDKAYSKDKLDKDSPLPLNTLFSTKTNTGKGYGSQYKIPKKPKEDEPSKGVANKTEHLSTKEVTKKDEKDKSEKASNSSKKRISEIINIEDDDDDVIEIDTTTEEPKGNKVEETRENKIEESKTEQEDDKETKSKPENTVVVTLESDKKTENKAGPSTDKKEEEENILSKFFQNLMKSGNKDEKKGALLSLISTFSDSFSDDQMQKITSIIKNGDVDEKSKKEEKEAISEEMPTSSTDDTVKNDEKVTESVTVDTSEKIDDNIEKNTEEEEEAETNRDDTKEVHEEEPVDSSTQQKPGKLKARRKSETPKAKLKTELDRLHDDIRDMFIRDGVVTATGKRMCRILKDNSTPTTPENGKVEEELIEEETEKKTTGPKKRGRKPAGKKNKEMPEVEMKELTVILPKMSFDKMRATDGHSNKEKDEKEENENKEEELEELIDHQSEDESEKETESNKEKTNPVRKGRPKKRNSWATGVIKKKPGPKSRKAKTTRSPDTNKADAEPDVSTEKTEDTEEIIKKDSNLHHKDYYYKTGQKSLQCKFCDVSTKWIAAHYRTEHPAEEVLSSRLPPNMAKAVIEDAVQNKDIYANDNEESLVKHEYRCCFCEYNQITLPRLYRDHVSIHTGEFRHVCPYCNFSRSHIKTMQGHVAEVHGEEEMVEKKPIISQRHTNNRNIYAYICQLCNFTQMSLENLQSHVKTYHSEDEKCELYKIKVNLEVKLEEEKKYVSDRPTRSSTKLNQSFEESASDVDDTIPLKTEVKTTAKVAEKKEESELPEVESATETETENKTNTTIEDEESEKETQPRKRLRKRTKSFSAPSPVKKRLKRKCATKEPLSGDNTENDSEHSEEKMVKNIDVAVFTSNTDIQEENKRIEEERMKTMQDINSTIKLRTSLDFVEKLSHRLKQEEVVEIKQEVEELAEEDVLEKLPANDLPVFEKSVLQNREIEPTALRQESSPKVGKDVERVNPINGVIEKLQGILGSQSTTCDDVASPSVSSEELSLPAADDTPPTADDTPPIGDDAPPALEAVSTIKPPMLKFFIGEPNNHPPPLIHMDNLDQSIERRNMINSETLNIGLIKIMKTTSTYIYVCCLPPCIFSSRDRAVFTSHCRYSHQWYQNSLTTTQCLECGASLASTNDTNLLICALNHAASDHSDFLGTKIGSIRISTNLFPESKSKDDDNDLDDPMNLPTISIPSPPDGTADDIDTLLDTEPVTEDREDENPFELRIVDVVSLADQDSSPIKGQDNYIPNNAEPSSPSFQESTPTREPTSISKLLQKYQRPQTKVTLRKSAIAFKKFLGNHFDLYKCPDFACLFTANKRKMFDIHLSMHQNHKKIVNCLYCDKLMAFQFSGDHYEKMHGMCRFSCSYCMYRCIAKDYMDIHQILAHPDMPSRMQLLPKRDLEEKNSLSILIEATKGTPLKPYSCCINEFTYTSMFIEHVNVCPDNHNFSCHFRTEQTICMAAHKTAKDLVRHWGLVHNIYPLKCHYCDVGDFDMNVMMIHLVLEHPTLPPDIVDREEYVVNKNKKSQELPSVHCNFKQLAIDLRPQVKGSNLATPEPPSVILPKPMTMQKAFENFLVQNAQLTMNNIKHKTNILKPTSKANVLNAGGVVYCLPAASSSANQVLQAIVVNSEASRAVPQKLLLSTSPRSDGKFQILKNVSKMMPIAPKAVGVAPKAVNIMPKLAPLTPVAKVVPSVETVTLQIPNAVLEEKDEGPHGGSKTRKEVPQIEEVSDVDCLEEPMVILDDDLGEKEPVEAVDPLSLEHEDPEIGQREAPATPSHEYDSDSKDVDQQDVLVQKSGLEGYQLYRCAKCDMFFGQDRQLKNHLIKSMQCRFRTVPYKPFKCYHCGKYLKHYTNLLDHLGYHGRPRFTCSLCNKQFPHSNQIRYHMKTQHNVLNVQMQPLIQGKSNLNTDSFIAKPQVVGSVKPVIQENKTECDTQKSTEVKTVYFSFEADQIPQKAILGYDVTCGHCKKFKNKVRSNIVRHLLLHQNDKEFSVPDTAPVNPVPCLEKNEKMFDKMYNLASSSHTGGRMGAQQKGETSKDKVKEADQHPAFVPSNKRYQCCAVSCNYLCLEEGNLRHHLTALHMEDLNFVCVHCKKDLSDAVDVDTIIKHLKLHDLHLYKCSLCDYMHNLRHKIERHINDEHKNKEVSVVVIRAMDAEPYDENQQQPFAPVVGSQKLQKLWKCCMCKYKCHTEEEVVNHVKNKHNIDCRYKCAWCTFKTNEVSEFRGHFKENHPDTEIDIILVYQKKDDDGNGVVPETDQFDTTPLWLRDKPRVRHIRGILFEEDPAMKKKSAQLKEQVTKDAPTTSVGKKRKRSMSTASETNRVEEELVEPKKETLEVQKKGNLPKTNEVIVIDDDEEVVGPEETTEEVVETSNAQDNDVELICIFGDLGMPMNKHFKCPKCEKYKAAKMKDFIQHVAGEIKYYRFMCNICQEKFITLENIQMHCIDYHNCSVSSVIHLPSEPQINRWLTLLLTEQANIIKGLGFNCETIPEKVENFLGTMESIQKMIKCKECNFSVSGMQALDRHMKYNHPHIAYGRPAASSTPDRLKPNTSDKKRKSEDQLEAVVETKKSKVLKNTLITKDKYVCNECKSEFDSVPEMEYHAKDIHDGEAGYTIKTTNIPLSWSTNRNIYRCAYCPNTGNKINLEIHIAKDHPGKKLDMFRYSCGVCSAKFDMLKPFRNHFKSHEAPKIFFYDINNKRVNLRPTNKTKVYRCPECSYCSKSVNSANMKTHLKLHAKPFKCDLCGFLFRTRADARAHHMKEHPHNNESITTREDMVQRINEMMDQVMKNIEVVEENESMFTDELIEDEPSIDILKPEVILKSTEEEWIDTESEDSKEVKMKKLKGYFAKKSTGKAKTEEEYSFYGQKADKVDMKKIITNFEIADAKMKMTCDQLGKIYNLNPIVKLKDCMTLIIEDEDEVSS